MAHQYQLEIEKIGELIKQYYMKVLKNETEKILSGVNLEAQKILSGVNLEAQKILLNLQQLNVDATNVILQELEVQKEKPTPLPQIDTITSYTTPTSNSVPSTMVISMLL